MNLLQLFRSHDVIRRFQTKPNGLLQSGLILLAISILGDLFPLGVMAGTSFGWMIFRMTSQSLVAVLLITWMWIVCHVIANCLIKRKGSAGFTVVRVVLVLTVAAMMVLNALPYLNSSGGHSIGWPFRFMYGLSLVSPFAAILDLAHGLIVAAFLLSVADRAIVPTPVPAAPPPS